MFALFLKINEGKLFFIYNPSKKISYINNKIKSNESDKNASKKINLLSQIHHRCSHQRAKKGLRVLINPKKRTKWIESY